jgi:hypothetical protein
MKHRFRILGRSGSRLSSDARACAGNFVRGQPCGPHRNRPKWISQCQLRRCGHHRHLLVERNRLWWRYQGSLRGLVWLAADLQDDATTGAVLFRSDGSGECRRHHLRHARRLAEPPRLFPREHVAAALPEAWIRNRLAAAADAAESSSPGRAEEASASGEVSNAGSRQRPDASGGIGQ